MKRAYAVAGVLVALLLVFTPAFAATPASAEPHVPTIMTSPDLPAALSAQGEALRLQLDFGTIFDQVDRVCFDFSFSDDLLDPGEGLFIELFGGFENVSSSPQLGRLLCSVDQTTLQRFADGVFHSTISIESGSVKLTNVQVFLWGVAAKHPSPMPGKGCGDEIHIHEREAQCKTHIHFIAPTPSGRQAVTPPFSINVVVKSGVPVALVRYFFYAPDGTQLLGANRETHTGYEFSVEGSIADVVRSFDHVLVVACAYSVDAPNDFANPLACTERTVDISSV